MSFLTKRHKPILRSLSYKNPSSERTLAWACSWSKYNPCQSVSQLRPCRRGQLTWAHQTLNEDLVTLMCSHAIIGVKAIHNRDFAFLSKEVHDG
jgi:hypothetical protein